MSEIDEFEKRYQAEQKLEQKQFEERQSKEQSQASDATNISQSQGEPSWGEMIMPQTTEMIRSSEKPTVFQMLTNPLVDIAGLGVRGLGAATGQGEITDPETNIFGGARQRMRDYIDNGLKSSQKHDQELYEKYKDKPHWTDALDDNDPDKYLLSPKYPSFPTTSILKIARQVGDASFEMLGDPFVAAGVAKGAVKQIGKTRLKGVPKSKLTQGGYKMSPAQATPEGKLKVKREAKEYKAQTNPFTEKFGKDLKSENLGIFEGKVSGASEGMGGKTVEGIEAGASRGRDVQKAAENVEDVTHKLYREGEAGITQPAKKSELLGKSDQPREYTTGGLSTPTLKENIKGSFITNAQKKMDDLLSSVGYKGGEITDTKSVSGATVQKTLDYKDRIGKAKNLGELINVKRNLGDEIFQGIKEGTFFGDKNKTFLRKINGKLNEIVEETITATFPLAKESKESLIKAYREMNKQYSTVLDVMGEPSKKLNLGKGSFNAGRVTDAIQSITPDALESLKTLSKTDPSVKAFYGELKKGSFENLITKSVVKNGDVIGISPAKFKTQWGKMKIETKKALFDDEFIKNADEFIKGHNKTLSGDAFKANPSGTAKMAKIIGDKAKGVFGMVSMAANYPAAALKAMFTYHALKHYYKHGKSVGESAINLVSEGARKTDKVLEKAWIDKAGKVAPVADIYKSLTREEK